MRKILFRGKQKDNGEWVLSVNLIQKYRNGMIKVYFPDGIETSYYSEIIPETVGQYTGLKDKIGRKIFEGDILENEKGTIYSGSYRCKVVFRDGMFLAEGFVAFSPNEFELCEVIGNIHDNPELMRSEQK